MKTLSNEQINNLALMFYNSSNKNVDKAITLISNSCLISSLQNKLIKRLQLYRN
jgi:hypothetical protein